MPIDAWNWLFGMIDSHIFLPWLPTWECNASSGLIIRVKSNYLLYYSSLNPQSKFALHYLLHLHVIMCAGRDVSREKICTRIISLRVALLAYNQSSLPWLKCWRERIKISRSIRLMQSMRCKARIIHFKIILVNDHAFGQNITFRSCLHWEVTCIYLLQSLDGCSLILLLNSLLLGILHGDFKEECPSSSEKMVSCASNLSTLFIK